MRNHQAGSHTSGIPPKNLKASLPRVTIVTPSYNQGQFIEETICSVLLQDYPNLEYIIVDGGSTDNSVDIIRRYESRLDYWVSEPDRGQTHAINKGWERATGNIITWLNSDDRLCPGALATIAEYLTEHPDVDIVFGDTLFTDADGTPIRRSKPLETFEYPNFVLNGENPVPQPSAFIRRSVMPDVGLLDWTYRYLMDWDYWLRAGLHHRIVYIRQLLSTYRLHPASKTLTQSQVAAAELQRMYRSYFERNDLPLTIRNRKREAMANMFFTSGNYYLEARDSPAAARAARMALTHYPELLLRPSMLHKFLYSQLATRPMYARARTVYHQARSVLRATTAES